MPSYISHQELMEGHVYLHTFKKIKTSFYVFGMVRKLILRLTYGTARCPEKEHPSLFKSLP